MRAVERIIFIIEMVIAGLLGIGIVIGLWDLVEYFMDIFISHQAESYELFQAFLGHALILIVGVELILMILYHSTKAILELVLFVIARKMLIYSNSMVDLAFGTVAIAVVFVILRYLVQDEDETIIQRDIKYLGTAKVKDICAQTGLKIPPGTDGTVGSLVCRLAKAACRPVEPNAEFTAGGVRIRVTKAAEDGTVEEVLLSDADPASKKQQRKIKKVTGIY